ncbi:MAG: mucoidy inhibitor MuiA family protein, partial [Eudoraea sp.]|nr:mucoidy inhibitor MuiA family protein [Eudoraea sp.]
MKINTLLWGLLTLAVTTVVAQEPKEKEVKTIVNDVTVFIEGAQVIRKKAVDLSTGTTILKFVDLSPFIKAKSLQVKADGDVTVISVNQQQNYLDKLEKSAELISLESQLEAVQQNIKTERTYLGIIAEEISFLQANKVVGGNQTLNAATLKSTSDYYSAKLTSLKLKELERNMTLQDLIAQERDIRKQINTITGKKEYANGEVLVKIETKRAIRTNLELSYVVGNARWYPSYDIRAKNVNESVQLSYKANVKQDTKIDWNNVNLKLSSANPNVSGIAPDMQTYFLDYNTRPPVYNRSVSEVSGMIRDQNNQPLPGVNVMVQGTTIGTQTDFDGRYTITVPQNGNSLQFSFIGFESKTVPINRAVINVNLIEDAQALDEVVVSVNYEKEMRTMDDNKRLAGVAPGVRIRGASTIPMEQVENQTTVDFSIDVPYTIKSDNKSYAVNMVNYDLPASYQYYSVPKIEKEAFLLAAVKDWEQYNLLEGEANIFFENTFVGKTILDVRYASDTLDI